MTGRQKKGLELGKAGEVTKAKGIVCVLEGEEEEEEEEEEEHGGRVGLASHFLIFSFHQPPQPLVIFFFLATGG